MQSQEVDFSGIFPRLGLAMIYITCINRLLPHFLICQQTMHYGQRLYRLTSKKFCRFISSLVANEWTMTNKVLNWAKSIWTNKSVEPTFFLFALAQGFYLIVAKNLYIDKVSITFSQNVIWPKTVNHRRSAPSIWITPKKSVTISKIMKMNK